MENSNANRVLIDTMAQRAEEARQQEEAKMLTEANQQAEAAKMHQEEIDKIEKRKAVNNFFIKSIQFGLALAMATSLATKGVEKAKTYIDEAGERFANDEYKGFDYFDLEKVKYSEETRSIYIQEGDTLYGIIDRELGGGGNPKAALKHIANMAENSAIFSPGYRASEGGHQGGDGRSYGIYEGDTLVIPTGWESEVKPLKEALTGENDRIYWQYEANTESQAEPQEALGEIN